MRELILKCFLNTYRNGNKDFRKYVEKHYFYGLFETMMKGILNEEDVLLFIVDENENVKEVPIDYDGVAMSFLLTEKKVRRVIYFYTKKSQRNKNNTIRMMQKAEVIKNGEVTLRFLTGDCLRLMERNKLKVKHEPYVPLIA